MLEKVIEHNLQPIDAANDLEEASLRKRIDPTAANFAGFFGDPAFGVSVWPWPLMSAGLHATSRDVV